MIDTRGYFRPLTTGFISLLRDLEPEQWDLPTAARLWRVRDVVAHLSDTAFRRVSFHRDHLVPPPASDEPFVAFINRLNAEWVHAMRRTSPRVLMDIYALAASELCDWIERLPLEAPPLFPVSWAGEEGDQGWLDIGREFTEQWHHQAQVREAVGDQSAGPAEWLHAVLHILLQGLPHAYRDAEAPAGTAIHLAISGAAGGDWTLRRAGGRWQLATGSTPRSMLTVHMSDAITWRLLFNALPADGAKQNLITWDGDDALIAPLLKARSVIV